MEQELWKGNEAIAEAAVRAGCRCFFGYPITPQNEIPEYMARRMPQVGGVFVQSESEVAAINMVYGAAAAGVRTMTSSSSPGISLKQEGISYLAGAELPAVIVNMVRGGPGLGSIQPSQCDYYQATRGGGNGDYRTPVLAPSGIQEATELVQDAFDLADRYRTPVLVLADGLIGQMMEPIAWRPYTPPPLPPKDWTAAGRHGRAHNNFVTSLRLDAADCEQLNRDLEEKYRRIARQEVRWAGGGLEDAQLVLVAYGTTARIASTAVEVLREEGIRAGLFRPITLWPFPTEALGRLAGAGHVKGFLTVEMSLGQMVDDVRLAVNGRRPVDFLGRTGGILPPVDEMVRAAKSCLGGEER